MILDGKMVAKLRNDKLKLKIAKDLASGLKAPSIRIINVGNDPASKSYIKGKMKAASKVGINSEVIYFSEEVEQKELVKTITDLNANDSVDGVLLQLPIPKHLDSHYLTNLIDPNKDIDGFTIYNQGLLFQKVPGVRPATPQGIINLLNHYEIDVTGLNALVIGRSQIVGTPVAKMLTDLNATVTVAHSRTKNLKMHSLNADLIIIAIGSPLLLKADMVKPNSIIIDVGINRLDGKLVGDADFNNLVNKVKYITPVPKGVGPMTINALLENAYYLTRNKL